MSVDFEAPITGDDIEKLFKIVLKRNVNDDAWRDKVAAAGKTFGAELASIVHCREFRDSTIRDAGAVVPHAETVDDYTYRLPEFLQLSKVEPKKVALIGSCLLDDWTAPIKKSCPGLELNRVPFNNASKLPALSRDEAAAYDFGILQVPIRSILPEAAFLNIKFSDIGGYEQLFEETCQRMRHNLDALLEYNEQYGMLSFVLNFFLPQQNPMGRMVGRYSLANMVYFMEEVNKRLHEYVSQRTNCYIIDLDEITNTFGKKYFQDDSVAHYNHGSSLKKIGGRTDGDRIEPMGDVQRIYTPNINKFILTVWHDALSQYRILQQTDSIKLVIFDLDDTLWSGIAAEMGYASVEGWPIGILEALSYLWKRGILVAIVSKNDEEPTRALWKRSHGFSIENFASVKINWREKADNIADILKEVNLLPGSVLFVDDNPAERAAVKAAFPDIRVMDAALAHWRRALLWSTELQRAVLTDEAIARTEMVQAQIQREQFRSTMSHEEFLASRQLRIKAFKISETSDRSFDRCFELLNKTNQFNTTGKRWTQAEIDGLFAAQGYFIAIDVSDKFTAYGITGLLIINENTIEQFVLSCRVFGMHIEQAAISVAQQYIGKCLFGKVAPTNKNHLSLDLYQNLGFTEMETGIWINAHTEVTVPAHIELSGA